MPTRRVIVSAHNGVHARPVAELVRLAQSHGAPVTLRTSDDTTVDLRSVLAVMDLGIESGDAVVLETAASDTSEALLDELVEVLAPKE
ncbi:MULTISPECIES: HPr family phosphocarrier protein [Microbacterium]|jgi:phosphocarrier protein|uniref:HPr family phosphocarrier protein n=1 Tax=Microbacterium TaxID=33882 RepID=UPI00047506C2|nr:MULTISPECIES: HPr family phosphocarrier protein [Microbacterium]AZH79185.1 HPr family phosphocarrier protein [Microbacterium sp. Y-01]MDX2399760.1 HPr family phosphocarrier protein [Microbacterium algeriense]